VPSGPLAHASDEVLGDGVDAMKAHPQEVVGDDVDETKAHLPAGGGDAAIELSERVEDGRRAARLGRHQKASSREEGAELSATRPVEGLSQTTLSRLRGSIQGGVKRCLGLSRTTPRVVKLRLNVASSGTVAYQGAEPAPPAMVAGCFRQVVSRAKLPPTGAQTQSVVLSFTGQRESGGAKREAHGAEKTQKRFKSNPFSR